jgi:hypothetical protein
MRYAFVEKHHCESCIRGLEKLNAFRIVNLRRPRCSGVSTEVAGERRKELRLGVAIGVMIPASTVKVTRGVWIGLQTVTVSRDGMGILTPAPLTVGSELTVALPGAGSVVELRATIRHCDEARYSNRSLVGLQFISLEERQRLAVDGMLVAAKTVQN